MKRPVASLFLVGIGLCLLGSVLFSSKAIIVKLGYRDTSVDAVSLLALRMIFSLPFFLSSAIFSSNRSSNVKFTRKQWWYIAACGLLGYYVSSLLDFLGLQYISAGMERLILFIYPTLVLLFSSIIFRQKIHTFQWVALAITYVGLSIAFISEVNLAEMQGENFLLGCTLVFFCSVTYALYIIGSGKMIAQVGSAKFNSYAMTFASIGVLIHFFTVSDQSLLSFEPNVYGYSMLMAVFATVIPSYLIASGIKRIGADNAAIVGTIGPVSTIIQAYFFLAEPIHAWQIFGTLLIVAGVLWLSRSGEKKQA
jgi:drug/metabolite transporter (DMT)-like permease